MRRGCYRRQNRRSLSPSLPHAPSPSSEWFWGARRGWFPSRRDHRPQYPAPASLLVKPPRTSCQHWGLFASQRLPPHRGHARVNSFHCPPSVAEEKGDSEGPQLCLCHQRATMFKTGQEPIYSTVRRIGGREKQSISFRPNISVLYLFQGEGKPEEDGREALVWKTGQDELTDKDPRRPHQDLADKPGLLTEDSVLKTLASRYHLCQYWVAVSNCQCPKPNIQFQTHIGPVLLSLHPPGHPPAMLQLSRLATSLVSTCLATGSPQTLLVIGGMTSGKSFTTSQLLSCLVGAGRSDTDLAKRSMAGLAVVRPLVSTTTSSGKPSSHAV